MVEGLTGFKPNIAIPPGETLQEHLEDLGMSQTELSARTGLSNKHINEIIKGKAPITPETSLKLEAVLGIPASFWNNLEASYRETLARIEQEKNIEEEKELLKQFPYSEMAKLGWIEKARTPNKKVLNLRSFFGVSSLKFIPDLYSVAFRKSESEKASPYALASWIRQGVIVASKIKTKPFDKKKLESYLDIFRSFTLKNPEDFELKLKKMCAECGIALVLLPHLPKTYAHGATKWLTPNKVLIILSLRYKFADIFWFSFFHEIGHVLKHGRKQTYINKNLKNIIRDDFEKQADKFASEILIPKSLFNELKNNHITRISIKNFSKKLGIHPGIVVGRLQHEGFIKHSQFNTLRVKFEWKDKI